MNLDRSPTEITEEGEHWLRSRDVSDSPRIGGDGYFGEHDVPHWDEVTDDDLPPTDDEAIREIDREALDGEQFIGKWQLTGSAERIEELWPEIVADSTEQTVWAAKAMTAFGHDELAMYDDYMIVVYTPNYFAKHDVDRVREHLRAKYGVTHELFYKPDIYTAKGIVAEATNEFGLSMPARYRA